MGAEHRDGQLLPQRKAPRLELALALRYARKPPRSLESGLHSSKSASDIRRGQEFVDGDTVGLLLDTDARTLTVYREGTAVARLQDEGLSAPLCFMSELCCGPHHPQTHDSGCAYTEGTVRITWAPPPIEEGEAEKKNKKPDKAKVNMAMHCARAVHRAACSH